jgi:hypothetical protein
MQTPARSAAYRIRGIAPGSLWVPWCHPAAEPCLSLNFLIGLNILMSMRYGCHPPHIPSGIPKLREPKGDTVRPRMNRDWRTN